jgi:hypothetical protein
MRFEIYRLAVALFFVALVYLVGGCRGASVRHVRASGGEICYAVLERYDREDAVPEAWRLCSSGSTRHYEEHECEIIGSTENDQTREIEVACYDEATP